MEKKLKNPMVCTKCYPNTSNHLKIHLWPRNLNSWQEKYWREDQERKAKGEKPWPG